MTVDEYLRNELSGKQSLGAFFSSYRDGLGGDMPYFNPWEGRTFESLSEAEKLNLLVGRRFGAADDRERATAELASGQLDDLNQGDKLGSEFGDYFGPMAVMAAAGLTGGAMGGAFGGAGAASGAAGGAMDMGVGGVAEAMGLGAGYTSPAAGSSLMDMIKATQGNTPYLRTGDIPNAAEGGSSLFGLNPNSTAPFSGLNVTQPAVDAFTSGVAEGMPTLEGTGAFSDMPWGVNPQAGSGGTDPFDTNIWGEGGGAGLTNYGTGGTLMPPADPSGINPNMVETGTTNWNPAIQASFADKIKSFLEQGKSAAEIGKIIGIGPGATSALGTAGSTILGVLGANNQSASLEKLASQFAGYGAPYRAQLASISQDPNQFYNSPTGQGALNAVLQKLSVGGNPAGDPYKQALATSSLYDKYSQERGLLGTLGGLSAYNAAAPGMSASAANSSGNMYNVLGYGLGQVTNPPQSLSDLAKAFGINSAA